MEKKPKNTIAVCLIVTLLMFASLPIISNAEKVDIEKKYTELSGIDKELNLLKGEHHLYLKAVENTSVFNVNYAFPPEYGYQLPIFLEILEDSNADIINYKIEEDVNEPNKLINFTIGNMAKDEIVKIHFNCWVLIESNDYSDMPNKVSIPKKSVYQGEEKKWLGPTEVVQSNKLLIKLRARMLKFLTFDVIRLAGKIARFCRNHHYALFYLQFKLGAYRSQDALTTLFLNGECPGRSHLGCALFRANNIPARVLLANPTYSFEFEMHYMTEYYLHNYGWVLTEVHGGKTPHGPENQIILRICYPEDENNTQTDFLFPKMKGIERWVWIDESNVTPYYKNYNEASRIKTTNEKKFVIDSFPADDVLNLTKDSYYKFEYFQGLNLSAENQGYFDNATAYHLDAIKGLSDPEQSQPVLYYYINLEHAMEEYNKIILRNKFE